MNNPDFDRSKIYEQLTVEPEPPGYAKRLPWIVQLQIAATNGIQYQKSIGKLDDYPKYRLPVAPVKKGLMLDIGTGWGRWLVAAEERGYVPIGLDLRFEFCKTALQTLRAQNKKGYAVVGDLRNLPFQDSIFDLVWSFSVIQHTCEERLDACLQHIHRILRPSAYTYLEFPNREGLRNRRGAAKRNAGLPDEANSWHVRYYSISEYRRKFEQVFGNFGYDVHSLLGIGVLPEDIKYVSADNKLKVALSLLGTALARAIPGLKSKADSIYVKADKQDGTPALHKATDHGLQQFYEAHHSQGPDNLHIVPLLRCPVSGGKLQLTDQKDWLLSAEAGLKYPVLDSIPILIESEAIPL